jgi:HSP20 family protein
MALVRYEPWNLLARLHNDIDRTFTDWSGTDTSGVTAEWIPPVDVEEYENRFELCVDLPGVDPKDVEITLQAGVLTLTGERRDPERGESVSHFRTERGRGRFHRRFILPETVDSENVKATGRNGVLEVTIPKQAAAQPRRIEIAA